MKRYALSLTLFNVAAQPENTYTLKGFTVGSRCVVWSRHMWSECEILEIAEEGTKVSKVEVLYLNMFLQTVKEILSNEKMQLNNCLPVDSPSFLDAVQKSF